MIIENKGYGYNDLSIIPATITTINSRKECNPFYPNGCLPIFTAPMSTVVDTHNIQYWEDNNIIPIVPRNIPFEDRKEDLEFGLWVAVSLSEFKELFCKKGFCYKGITYKVLIDVANGHMKQLYDATTKAKLLAKDYEIIIMVGNIANPKTYDWICRNTSVDYVRVNIGAGEGCITSSNTGIHYPAASLINECYKIQKSIHHHNNQLFDNDGVHYACRPAIIADGGIRNYSDVIKCLALGANYVMIGGLFASLFESAGETWVEGVSSINALDYTKEEEKKELIAKSQVTKIFYGMASAQGQIAINGEKTKTSEGICKVLPVKYTLKQWTDNMIAYLRSAMSYTGSYTLDDFIGKVDLIVNSPSEINAVNK